jgi:hypothetical protein
VIRQLIWFFSFFWLVVNYLLYADPLDELLDELLEDEEDELEFEEDLLDEDVSELLE